MEDRSGRFKGLTGEGGREPIAGPARSETASVQPATARGGPIDSGRTRAAQRSLGGHASQLIVGRLKEHGRAPYQFRANEDVSYYLKVVSDGRVKILWGKDLERAIGAGETKPKAGDLIGARRTGRDAVMVVDRKVDSDGNVRMQSEHHAHRTRWEVEKVQLFSQRARQARLVRDAQLDSREAVRRRPELRSAFLSLRAAEQLAEKRISNPEDRERFLSMVREAMSASIQRGDPVPDIGLKTKLKGEHPSSTTPGRKRDRNEPTR